MSTDTIASDKTRSRLSDRLSTGYPHRRCVHGVMKIEINGRVVEISDSVKERLSRAIYAARNFANAVLDIPPLFFIIIVRNTNKPRPRVREAG